jgi:hypothetical protein
MALTMLWLVSNTGPDIFQIICFLEFHSVCFSLMGFSRGISFFIKVSEIIGVWCKAKPVGTAHACSRWFMFLSTSVADPGFFPSRTTSKNLSILNPKIVSKLSEI